MTQRMSKNRKITIVTHKLYHGVADDLKRYLVDNCYEDVWFISHDFAALSTRVSRIIHYKNGKVVLDRRTRDYRVFPEIIVNVKDLLATFWWLLFLVRETEVLFGFGAINTVVGIVLRGRLRVTSIVFYSIDFVPRRFDSSFLNWIYHLIERVALKRSTESWNLSPRMAEGRERLFNLGSENYKQRVVPVGLWLEEFPKYKFDEINRYELIFIGHLLEKQGVQLVLSAITEIKKVFPEFKFRIIGSGDYETTLRKIVLELDLEQYVIFEGAIFDQKIVNEKLARAAIGVALYSRELDTFTYYADPTKIKTYLAAGLPVLLTDLPYNAMEIAENGAGIIVPYDEVELAKVVIEVMQDKEKLISYRNAAVKYSRRFDWTDIFREQLGNLK